MKVFPHDKRYIVLIRLLKQIRKEANLYQNDIAEKLNKPQSFVSKYENGERRIDPIELYMICDVLGISFINFARRFDKQLTKNNLND